MSSRQLFHVGVQVVLARDGRILLGLRNTSTAGAGQWSLPGGHIEHGETPEAAARRELAEETGLRAVDAQAGAAFCTYITPVPYVHIPVTVTADGNPAVQPGECFDHLGWFPLGQLPTPMFPPSEQAVQTATSEG